jgi:hypothetical protein
MSLASSGLAASNFLPHISGFGGSLFAVILALVALTLMFSGRSIIKGLAFLVVGLAGAAFGAAVLGGFLGVIGAVIGGVLGFLVGGAVGLLLVDVGMGLALGYFGYLVTRDLTNVFILAVVVGVILFVVGVAISSKLLDLVTAMLGGVILDGVLVFFGVPPLYAAVVSLLLAVIGFSVQISNRRRGERLATGVMPSASGRAQEFGQSGRGAPSRWLAWTAGTRRAQPARQKAETAKVATKPK